ncbi:uncharacterized protein B0H18DRAFT_1036751 [Fomitopsis serialis]|uniref:uncharacterized protein n=1 Tax=Fomitopsis serialis TaxID=139415 RepID=UPI0020079B96|nr:uncharacterized protein B0H18DRAFT_1036751 [Neoantrodia serialis]KAH9916878.1 hypothetical protein B0H18DRAFT_1036751 [Neoantrodia serialis]
MGMEGTVISENSPAISAPCRQGHASARRGIVDAHLGAQITPQAASKVPCRRSGTESRRPRDVSRTLWR